jgi:hypothetical protein
LEKDIPPFNGIVAALLPAVEVVDQRKECLVTRGRPRLQLTDFISEKVVQLQDAMGFRSGMMIIGPTRRGKRKTMMTPDKTTSISFVSLRTFSWNKPLY